MVISLTEKVEDEEKLRRSKDTIILRRFFPYDEYQLEAMPKRSELFRGYDWSVYKGEDVAGIKSHDSNYNQTLQQIIFSDLNIQNTLFTKKFCSIKIILENQTGQLRKDTVFIGNYGDSAIIKSWFNFLMDEENLCLYPGKTRTSENKLLMLSKTPPSHEKYAELCLPLDIKIDYDKI